MANTASIVRFEVRSGLNGTDRDTWSSVADFDNGKDAAAWVSHNKAAYQANGKTLAIVRVELDKAKVVDWRERERTRLQDGTYTNLPGDWFELISYAYPDHFPHVAESDKRKVAFTESESSGERDRQKVLDASTYMSRYFSNSCDAFWYVETRAQFVADMQGNNVFPLFAPLGDAAALVRIYRECKDKDAHGCMSYEPGHFACSPMHPVEVYAMGGEITVAFLRSYPVDTEMSDGEYWNEQINPSATWDGEGIVLARCLVWDDSEKSGRKEYGRVYGQSHHARILRTALENAGYRSGQLEGARIAKVYDPEGGYYVMPYLDIGHGRISDDSDDDDYFTVGGNISSDRTDGWLRIVQTVCCDHCEEDVPENAVIGVHTGRYSEEMWCNSCASGDASWCSGQDMYVSADCAVTVRPYAGGRGRSVPEWDAEDAGYVFCDRDGTYYVDGFRCDDCGRGFPGLARDDSFTGDDVCTGCGVARREAEAAESDADSDDDTNDDDDDDGTALVIAA